VRNLLKFKTLGTSFAIVVRKVQIRLLSAEKPAWPEHENGRNESSGHGESVALAGFQGDLLGELHVSDRQLPIVRKHRPSFGRPFSSISQTFDEVPG
jgi:hypothetical protein